MSTRLRFSSVLLLTVPVFVVSTLRAQAGLEFFDVYDPDRPPAPPFISLLAIVAAGKTPNDPSLPVKGPVVEVLAEELRTHDTTEAPAGAVAASITTRYDEQGRVTEEIRSENGTDADTMNRYRGSRMVSQETTFSRPGDPLPKIWSYWTYDKAGHLSEYRSGAGGTLQAHLTSFQRDADGRLASFEYRRGAADDLFCRTELKYSADGQTLEIRSSDATGVFSSLKQTADEQGRIVEAVTHARGSRGRRQVPPLKVAFRYDDKGRLIEQETDEYNFEANADEGSLPPGKVSRVYDDRAHTRTNVYQRKELGMWSSTVTYDPNGAAIANAFEVNGHSSDMKMDCAYDERGNWTNCAELGGIAGPESVARVWRRKITYREGP